MVDLVSIKNGEVVADSRIIAEKFGKGHDRVLKSIDKLHSNIENIILTNKRTRNGQYTFDEKIRTVRGRDFRYFEMNRNAFSILVMGFTGKKALKWKIDFIEAFNTMEGMLLNRKDLGWKQIREDGKNMRLEFTGCIAEFVEYCHGQGSKNAKRYYGNLTKMEYVALRFLEYKEKVPSNFRDTLDKMKLFMIVMAEHVANETIKKGMADGLHYKEIFIHAKQAVLEYAGTVLFDKIEH